MFYFEDYDGSPFLTHYNRVPLRKTACGGPTSKTRMTSNGRWISSLVKLEREPRASASKSGMSSLIPIARK